MSSLRGFCIHEHAALAAGWHEDFRVEFGGVALSWALPKGLQFDDGKPRLAVRTPDHPVPYMDFEGELVGYGAGTVRLAARGRCELVEWDGASRLVVRLPEPRAGTYVLRRLQGDRWLAHRRRASA